jgi:DNA-directed RNA polymerase subunit RPC12/RpoP
MRAEEGMKGVREEGMEAGTPDARRGDAGAETRSGAAIPRAAARNDNKGRVVVGRVVRQVVLHRAYGLNSRICWTSVVERPLPQLEGRARGRRVECRQCGRKFVTERLGYTQLVILLEAHEIRCPRCGSVRVAESEDGRVLETELAEVGQG